MVATRRSSSLDPNPKLQEETLNSSKGNRGWLAEKGDADGIILLGGTSLADFRIRYAQSSLRHDLTPSSWSRCGILLAAAASPACLSTFRVSPQFPPAMASGIVRWTTSTTRRASPILR